MDKYRIVKITTSAISLILIIYLLSAGISAALIEIDYNNIETRIENTYIVAEVPLHNKGFYPIKNMKISYQILTPKNELIYSGETVIKKIKPKEYKKIKIAIPIAELLSGKLIKEILKETYLKIPVKITLIYAYLIKTQVQLTIKVPIKKAITIHELEIKNIEVSEKGVIITYVCTLTSSFTLKDVTLLIVANGAQLSADKIDIYIGTTTIEKQVTIPPNIIKQALYNSILLEIYLSKNNIKVPLKKITIGPILVNKIKVIKVNVDIFQMKVYAEILVPLNKTIVPENIILPLIILQRNAQGAVVSKTSLQIKPVNNVIKLEFKVALQTRAIEIILENPFNITLVKYGIGGE